MNVCGAGDGIRNTVESYSKGLSSTRLKVTNYFSTSTPCPYNTLNTYYTIHIFALSLAQYKILRKGTAESQNSC
jgi:hypothetical protein